MDEHDGQDGQEGPEKSQEAPNVAYGGTTRGGPEVWGFARIWQNLSRGPTQLHPFGGAGSKTPTGRVTGAPSFPPRMDLCVMYSACMLLSERHSCCCDF